MFDELRELAETMREHAPVVVAELRSAVRSLGEIAEHLNYMSQEARERDARVTGGSIVPERRERR